MKFPIVVLSCLFLGAGAPFVPGTAELVWDPVITDTTGAAAVASQYEVAVSLRTADVTTGGAALKSIKVTAPKVDRTLAVALFNGLAVGEYRVWIRGIHASGINGLWSDPLLVELRPLTTAVVLAKPINLRVIEVPLGTGVLIVIPPQP